MSTVSYNCLYCGQTSMEYIKSKNAKDRRVYCSFCSKLNLLTLNNGNLIKIIKGEPPSLIKTILVLLSIIFIFLGCLALFTSSDKSILIMIGIMFLIIIPILAIKEALFG